MSKQKTKLDVVAKMAGVSTATVSRVINGKPGVSQEKAAEVQDIIRRMNFQPAQRQRSALARATAGFRHGNVAIFVLGHGHFEAPELLVKQLDAISRTLLEKQINPILIMGSDNTCVLPPAVKRGQIDGIIVFGEALPDTLDSLIADLPVVRMTSHRESHGDVVLAGNFEIGQAAANYLIGHSCRSLLAFNSVPANPVLQCRCAAFALSAEQRGRKVVSLNAASPASEKGTASTRKLVQDLVTRIQMEKISFDGIFVPDDRIAAVAHPLLKENGLLDPQKVRMISCGNEENYLLGLHPRPASIDIGPEILGEQAVHSLCRRAQGEDRNMRVNVTISPHIIEGD
ncbi:MAG: LacI family DNA-binding transcriptional regulator [Chthoniobacterales bacterium]